MANEKKILLFGILFILISILIISILFVYSLITIIFYKSILFGALVSTLNFIVGMLFIYLSIEKSEKFFLITLWGGFIFRLILILLIIVFMLIFLEINKGGFIFSVFFFYIFYLIIEILYLNSRRIKRFDGK